VKLTPSRRRPCVIPLLVTALALGMASSSEAASAVRRAAVPSWPAPIPTSARLRTVWSGTPDCSTILRYVRGERAPVEAARWRRPHDAQVTLGPQIRDPDFIRVAQAPTGRTELFGNTVDPDDYRKAKNTLGLFSADRQTQWPLVEGLVQRDAPNVAGLGGLSTMRWPCRACADGVRIYQPQVGRARIVTDLIATGGHPYQLYATVPARYVSVWRLRLTAPLQASNTPACVFART
jgi:hypothetical protein